MARGCEHPAVTVGGRGWSHASSCPIQHQAGDAGRGQAAPRLLLPGAAYEDGQILAFQPPGILQGRARELAWQGCPVALLWWPRVPQRGRAVGWVWRAWLEKSHIPGRSAHGRGEGIYPRGSVLKLNAVTEMPFKNFFAINLIPNCKKRATKVDITPGKIIIRRIGRDFFHHAEGMWIRSIKLISSFLLNSAF